MGSAQPLHRAIAKYGPDAFTHEVLETCETLDAANESETRWISHYRSDDLAVGYNLDSGGKSHNSNEVSRRKIGDAARAAWAALSPEQHAERVASMRHIVSPEESAKRRAWWAAKTPEERSAIQTNGTTPEERRARALKSVATKGVDAMKASAQKGAGNRMARTPEEYSASLQKAWASRRASKTDEERHVIAVEASRKRFAATTPEQRSEIARMAKASMTPDERSNHMTKAWVTRRKTLTNEAKLAMSANMRVVTATRLANSTPEERSAVVNKAWETRRGDIAAACPPPSLRVNLLRLGPRVTTPPPTTDAPPVTGGVTGPQLPLLSV